MRNDHLPEPIAQVVNTHTKYVQPWRPTQLCQSCAHARDQHGLRCAHGVVAGFNGSPRMILCEQQRSEIGRCERAELYEPVR